MKQVCRQRRAEQEALEAERERQRLAAAQAAEEERLRAERAAQQAARERLAQRRKQAPAVTTGDTPVERAYAWFDKLHAPTKEQMDKAIAKYDAWASLKGKTKEDAQKEYIDLINSLKG